MRCRYGRRSWVKRGPVSIAGADGRFREHPRSPVSLDDPDDPSGGLPLFRDAPRGGLAERLLLGFPFLVVRSLFIQVVRIVVLECR